MAPTASAAVLLLLAFIHVRHSCTDGLPTVQALQGRARSLERVLQVSSQDFYEKPDINRRFHSKSMDDDSSLVFRGKTTKTSEPLAPSRDKETLIEFFKSFAARDLLFVSDAAPIPVSPISPKLFHEWQLQAQTLGASIPTLEEGRRQAVMQLCSNGISFSGLTVETTVDCGAKLIDCNPDTSLPAYEFTMIRDSTKASGPRPLMWIYNQVMKFVAKKRSKLPSTSSNKTTTSLCRVSLVEKGGGVALHFESSFQVKMAFPPFLLKILPVSKSRAEYQGSEAVATFVKKGVLASLERFQTAFAESKTLAARNNNVPIT